MPLTEREREAVMARVVGDEVLQARQLLRDAMWRWVCMPFSHARLNAFLDAFERLQDVNANRVIGNMAPLVVPLERRISALERRVDALEQRERLSGTA